MNDFNTTTQPIRRFFSLRRDVKSYVHDPLDIIFDLKKKKITKIPEEEFSYFTPTAWSFLLMVDPSYAEQCPWDKLSAYQINKIYKVHPHIVTNARTAHLPERIIKSVYLDIDEVVQAVMNEEEPVEEIVQTPTHTYSNVSFYELTADLSIDLDNLEDQPKRLNYGSAWSLEEADIHYDIVISGVLNFVKILKHEYYRQHGGGLTVAGPMTIHFKSYNFCRAYRKPLQKCKHDCKISPAGLAEVRHSLLLLQNVGYLTFFTNKTKPLSYGITIPDPSLNPKKLIEDQYKRIKTYLYNNRYRNHPITYSELEEKFYHAKFYLDKLVKDGQLYVTKDQQLCYQMIIVDGLAYSHIARLALLIGIDIGYYRKEKVATEDNLGFLTCEAKVLRRKGYLNTRDHQAYITDKGKYLLFSLFDQIPELNPFNKKD